MTTTTQSPAPPKVYLPKDDARNHAKMYYNKLADDTQVLVGDFFDDLAESCAKKRADPKEALDAFKTALREKRDVVEERFNAYFERYGGRDDTERTYKSYVEALSRLISKTQKQKRDEASGGGGGGGEDLVYTVMDYSTFMHTLFKRVVHTALTNARFYFDDVKPFKWEQLYVKTVEGVLKSIIPTQIQAAPANTEQAAPAAPLAPSAPAAPASLAPQSSPGTELPPDRQWNETPNSSAPEPRRGGGPRVKFTEESSELWS